MLSIEGLVWARLLSNQVRLPDRYILSRNGTGLQSTCTYMVSASHLAASFFKLSYYSLTAVLNVNEPNSTTSCSTLKAGFEMRCFLRVGILVYKTAVRAQNRIYLWRGEILTVEIFEQRRRIENLEDLLDRHA